VFQWERRGLGRKEIFKFSGFDTFNLRNYIASNEMGTITDGEEVRIWKVAVVTYLKAL
jgi:hypothetical protein